MKELTAKDKLIENLLEQIACLQEKLFGTSSEKHSLVVEGQLSLFDEVETESAKDGPEPDAEKEIVTILLSICDLLEIPYQEFLLPAQWFV